MFVSDEKENIKILWVFVLIVFLHDVYYLWLGLTSPALGEHSYRQTQTAITAYWARHDGLRLAYETPIMGAPWSIPLEFPLYQWLVAGLNVLGLPIDVGGRLVSFAFLLACAWPLAIIRRALALPRIALPLTLAVFFAAPLLIYWGCAVLIETCAVFLALLWLALVIQEMAAGRFSMTAGGLAALVGSLAILQKSTTFPAFGVVGGCLVAYALARRLRTDRIGALRVLGFGVVTGLLPLAVGIAWIEYADAVKLDNPFGFLLLSYNLNAWNYGTWAQRHSIELLMALQRAAKDILGLGEIFALCSVGFVVAFVPRYRLMSVLALLGFLVPYALFTNLHIVHNYYQVANAVFLVAAVAFAVTGILVMRSTAIGLALLAILVAGQLVFFHQRYAAAAGQDFRTDDRYRIAQVVRHRTDPHDALLVLGDDFSSALNYYSERKGIALSTSVPKDLIRRVFDDPERFLGGLRLGGIVACQPFEFSYGDNDPMVEAFLARHQVLATEGTCRLYAPRA